MPISGLVVTLSTDLSAANSALEALRSHHSIVVGDVDGGRVPIVVDTPDSPRDRDVWDWINDLPGVSMVAVAYAHFDDDEDGAPSVAPAPSHHARHAPSERRELP